MRRLGVTAGGLLATLALALPAAAPASVVEVSASAGPAAEEYLEYRASKGEANRVQVNMKGRDVVIVDRGVKRIALKRTPFGRCRATSARRVVCPGLSVFLILRDGDDTASFAPGADGSPPKDGDPFAFDEEYEDDEGAVDEATYVDGGAGDDRLKGTVYSDVIVPGPGRDKVFARGGDDEIHDDPDGADDHLRGGGDADALHLTSASPVSVDLAANIATAGAETDSVAGFERVHGSAGPDSLIGSDRSEALYGEGGGDRIDGRGGNDLLFGDSPSTTQGNSSPNDITGGGGDDFIDVRSRNLVTTSPVDCGDGEDVFTGEVDDQVRPSCERVALRFGTGETFYEDPPDFDDRMRAFPVATELDGDPVYEFTCPKGRGACSGTIALESIGQQPAPLGSGSFEVPAGQSANVTVNLSAEGRAAMSTARAVTVRVQGKIDPGGGRPATAIAFGWQHTVGS